MDSPFEKIKLGCLNDHFDLLGGGTAHSFKFLEYLKPYYDCDVYLPGEPKGHKWMRDFLNLDTEGLTFHKYNPSIGGKYKYIFLNVSHWRVVNTDAKKKWALVFFPQFFFPTHDFNFLANSEYTKKNIQKRWKVPKKKIEVVYPPIMTEQFSPTEKTNSIMHVSRITPPVPEADKGHSQMIGAFKRLCDSGIKGWTFNIVGQIQDRDYYSALEMQAVGYPIKFHTGVSFNELRRLYGQAKIYWHMTGVSMPNEAGAQEHFGMVIVEAMASGAVPISLNTGGTPEIITNTESGFLVSGIDGLLKRTKQLINAPKKLEKLSEGAVEGSKKFSEVETKKKFYSVIARTDKVSIIILCHNNLKFTQKCLEHLYKVTPPGFELILVDNASTDGTRAYIKKVAEEHPDVSYIFNKENMGFAKANNKGLKKAAREYVCYLNNDTEPQWGWLERMVDVLEERPKVGVVGARLYFPKKSNQPWKIQHAGIKLNDAGIPKHIGRFTAHSSIREEGLQEVDAVTGACMLVRKKLARFDEVYKRGYFEDVDLCLRVREGGSKVCLQHYARLTHKEGATQNILKARDSQKFKEVSEQNKETFLKLWKGKLEKLPKPSPVIDVSTSGLPTKVEVGGGELPKHPGWAQVDVRKLSTVTHTADARALPFPSNSLNNIYCGHMLQCLTKDEAHNALTEWFRCLKPGGKLEIHVPDVNSISRTLITTEEKDGALREMYGHQTSEVDYYKWGYSFRTLDIALTKANFVRVTPIKEAPERLFDLGVVAYKPGEV